MIRVLLPAHLRQLAHCEREVLVEAEATQRAVLDALERQYPVLRGTMRDAGTGERRAFVRFFACEEDLSHEQPDAPLPDAPPTWEKQMKVIVFVKATADSEAGIMPTEQLLAEMTAYNEQLVKAGIMLAGEGLHPSSRGARVQFSGKSRTVVPGPFSLTSELVAGFWIWQVKSMEEAIEWAKRCPNPMPGDSELEIRPVFGPEDFGPEFTPELREREEQLRKQVESA